MATKKIAANLDLLTNQLQNFAIENVAARSTPAVAQAGRIVFDTTDHALYLNNGSEWVKLAEGTDATEAINALNLSLNGNKIKLSNGAEQDLSSILGFQTAKVGSTAINSSAQKTLTFKGTNGITVSATASGEITHTLSGLSFDTASVKNTVILKANGNELARFDSSTFVKDGMLKTVLGPYKAPANGTWTVQVADGASTKTVDFGAVKEGNTYIGFVWDTDVNDTSDTFTAMALDVSSLMNIYSAGNGLDLDKSGKFFVKLGGQDEGYLTFDGNGYLITDGINDKITASVKEAKDALDGSIGDLDKRLGLAENNIVGHAATLAGHTTQIKGLATSVTTVESAYAAGDKALLGDSSDDAKKNTIYGVRNYATNVARLMGGYYLSKLVISGNSVVLYANPDSTATTNVSGLTIDLASISVRVGDTNTYELEVETQRADDGTVTLSWSGITPDTDDNKFVVNYRVILSSSTGV